MSQFFKTREEIVAWLNKMDVDGYRINADLTVSVDGNVNLSRKGLVSLPVRFMRVDGHFLCRDNRLATLAGAPISVGASFYCYDNQLTSLENAPSFVGENFDCSHNHLANLVGAPSSVGGNFSCSRNNLFTLVGGPDSVGGQFSCSKNELTSLSGAPSSVGGNFDCDFSGTDLRKHISALFGEGRGFSAGNLTALCAEIRAEMDAEAMSFAIGGEASGPAVARRKAVRA